MEDKWNTINCHECFDSFKLQQAIVKAPLCLNDICKRKQHLHTQWQQLVLDRINTGMSWTSSQQVTRQQWIC
jgi:hypothetical protein